MSEPHIRGSKRRPRTPAHAAPAASQAAPLLFVNRNPTNFHQSRDDAAIVASHVSARYRSWKRRNERTIALDDTTRAILGTNKRRRVDKPSTSLADSSDCKSYTTNNAGTDTPPTELSADCSNSSSEDGPPPLTSEIVAESDTSRSAKTVIADDFVQLTSRLQSLAPITDQSVNTVAYAWRLFEDSVIPRPTLLGHHSLDPFSSFGPELDLEMKSNIHCYFKVIRPFAVHLIDSWWWCDSLPQIQSSRVLAYAIAAYSSIFLSGCLRGGPGVVLPPPVEPGQRSRWPNPPWLRLQTICLTELNAQLQSSGTLDESCFAAMLSLFRISVLLADGPSGHMHAKALKKIGSSMESKCISLNTELAVTKVNIIAAFLHHQSTVVVKSRPNHARKQLSHVVEVERHHWHLDEVWTGFRAALNGRVLAWQDEDPAARLQARTEAELIRMDSGFLKLSKSDQLELQLCYQIALFLSHILHCISFNTATPRIRRNVILLKEKLSSMDVEVLTSACPNLLFSLLLCGAVACHGYIERLWFVARLSMQFPDVRYMEDLRSKIAMFIDPMTWITELIQEVLVEMLKLRSPRQNASQNFVLWRKDISWRRPGDRPLTRTPNLSSPRAIVEEVEDCDVQPEFE